MIAPHSLVLSLLHGLRVNMASAQFPFLSNGHADHPGNTNAALDERGLSAYSGIIDAFHMNCMKASDRRL